LVGIAENRQKAVETRQKAVKIPPTAAPILIKRVASLSHLKDTYQISSL
jgi:hypothetical protein